jgi:hypothetical protein
MLGPRNAVAQPGPVSTTTGQRPTGNEQMKKVLPRRLAGGSECERWIKLPDNAAKTNKAARPSRTGGATMRCDSRLVDDGG